MVVRRLTAVAAGVGVMLFGAHAHAQSKGYFGDPGEFVFSADRLLPVLGYSSESTTQAGQLPAGISKISTTENASSLGFFWGGTPGYVVPLGGNTATLPNLFTVPRLGFDYTIIPNLTIGGDLILFFTLGGTVSTETDNNAGGKTTTSVGEPKSTIFGVAPRAGYILHLTDLLAIWLRGGLSVYTAGVRQTVEANNVNTTTSFNAHQWAIDLDPQLVITPIPHFGFNVGLSADIPFAGGYSVNVNQANTSNTVKASQSLLFMGMTGGLVGWF